MSMVIGIDAGISSTKIIGIENGERIMEPMSFAANDTTATVNEVLSKYLLNNGIALQDVEHVMLTGVGTRELKTDILGCPASHVDEFIANGLGARFDSGLDHMIVVSMGTGTSLVRVDGNDIRHVGGIGMGGGTLQGLAQLLLNTSDMEVIRRLADDGMPERVNLRINDICDGGIDKLTGEATASLFAKVLRTAHPTDNDIAAGLIHMVLETIGSASVLSQLNGGFKDFVLVGRLTELSLCRNVFPELEKLYGVRFYIPRFATYCTALGAALSYKYENE